MFKKMFGNGAGATRGSGDEATATAPPPPPPHAAAAHPPTIPENEEIGGGPVDYAPPPLGVHDDNFGTFAASGDGGDAKHFDAAEAGRVGAASAARPSFVWAGSSGPGSAGSGHDVPGGPRSTSWLGGGADLTQRDHSFDGGISTAVKRVSSVSLARRLSRRSSALSADFERRRSSANFAKLGSDHDGHSSWMVGTSHLITAMIGAGILGLPNSFAWLGWIGGCICLVFFLFATVFCLLHLIECYHVGGIRHHKYADAVFHICGSKHAIVLAVSQRINMYLTAAAYTGAAGHSLSFLLKAHYTLQGLPPSTFAQTTWLHTLIFGCLQLFMSQLPNLEAAWWSSAIGAGERERVCVLRLAPRPTGCCLLVCGA
jgi:hypothetical protein